MNECQKSIKAKIARLVLNESDMRKYWAAYLNMARNNLFTTLKFIGAAVDAYNEREDIEGNIPKMAVMTKSFTADDEVRVKELFYKYFPFLRAVRRISSDENKAETIVSLEDLRIAIKNIAYTLSFYRNKYSHSIYLEKNGIDKTRQERTEKDCGVFLQGLLTFSVRVIKERYRANKNSAQKGMIDSQSMNFLTEGKVKRNPENGMSFDCEYYLNMLSVDSSELSFFGKLMLACTLLEKKYATELLTQCLFLGAFCDTAKPPRLSERRLMLEVMTAMRIRLPEKKLSVEKDETQIALDILNELKKCPGELYELLGDEDRARFNVMSDAGENILQKRYSDRFPQLALSWLDASEAFKNLRFQVNSGKFRYLFRKEKHCIDGKIRPRVLEEPLNGFRRLQEFENARRQKLEDESDGLWEGYHILNLEAHQCDDKEEEFPYITDSAVKYVFEEENIGMSISGDYTPEVRKDVEGVRYRVGKKIPDCYISKYELPGMLFYHLICQKASDYLTPSAEEIVVDAVKRYRKLFSDIRDGKLLPVIDGDENSLRNKLEEQYRISVSDVPAKLRDYLLCKNIDADAQFLCWKKERISSMIKDTEIKKNRIEKTLKVIGTSENKPGSKNYVYLKPGSYAAFIAKDIIFFQDEMGMNKMTGLNYNVLQSVLATFHRDGATTVEILVQTLRKAGLISEGSRKGSHPFLFKVMSKKPLNIIDLYKYYLDEKLSYLRGTIPDDSSFLHSERIRWQVKDSTYYKALAGRYLERPIQLPRQLFERHILDVLLKQYALRNPDLKSALQEAVSRGNCNTTYMIFSYYENCLEDGPQPFYGLSEGDLEHDSNFLFYKSVRSHISLARKVLNGLGKGSSSLYRGYLKEAIDEAKRASGVGDSRSSLPSADNFAVSLKKSYNDMMEMQKRFRRYAVQDEVLFLAAKSTVKNAIGLKVDKSNLGEIMPDKRNILDTVIPSVYTSYPVDSGNKRKAYVRIVQNDIKLKDYGRVFRLMHDNRLNNLLKSHNGSDVDMSDIVSELEKYDSHRVGAFEDILNYEGKISKGHSKDEMKNDKQVIDFSAIQRLDSQNSEEDKCTIRHIRNAFSHNQYPFGLVAEKLYGTQILGASDKMTKKLKDIEEQTK